MTGLGRTRRTGAPRRGDIWLADLDPTRGHEQRGTRPVLVCSASLFNAGPAELVVICPLTSRLRPIPTHVRVQPPEGGLRLDSAIMGEAVRSVARDRLRHRLGAVRPATMQRIEDVLRILLEL